jgi:hypothetical protein
MSRLLLVSTAQVCCGSISRRRHFGLALIALLLSSSVLAQTPLPGQQTPPPVDAVSPPALQILGYGDINFLVENKGREPGGNHFRLGQFDLLFLSNLSDTWRVLAEPVIRVESNEFTTELERFIVTYAPRDYFELGLGRYNTSFGYYGSTYSHSTYFQTAASRPILFEFEDDGGLLPEHNTGITVTGRLRGSLRARYIVEIGNGQPLRSSTGAETDKSGAEEPSGHAVGSTGAGQSVTDENRSKAMNLGLQIRPAGVPGLQLGGNAYFDKMGPTGAPAVNEKIFGAFVAYHDEHWELLAEGVGINTRLGSGRDFRSGGFYAQVARQFAAARPFARYQNVSVPDGEPGLGHEAGRTSGPSFGLRLDPGPYVALKFQVDRFGHSNRAAESSFIAQVSFAF